MSKETIIENTYCAKLKNVGKLLAMNVSITRKLENIKGSTMNFEHHVGIAPYEKVNICTFKEEVSNNSKYTISIDYDIIFGVHSEITFVKEQGIRDFTISKFIRMKSPSYTPLLNSFADLLSILRLLTSLWRLWRFFTSLLSKHR